MSLYGNWLLIDRSSEVVLNIISCDLISWICLGYINTGIQGDNIFETSLTILVKFLPFIMLRISYNTGQPKCSIESQILLGSLRQWHRGGEDGLDMEHGWK